MLKIKTPEGGERGINFISGIKELIGSAGATIFTLIKVQREGKANSNATKIID